MISSIQLSTKNLDNKSSNGVSTYVAQWPIYSLAWSFRHDDPKSRIAIGSFLDDHQNKVELVHFNPTTSDFTTTSDHRLVFDHPYAATNLMFLPSEDTSNPNLIATSGDFLRIWDVKTDRVELRTLLDGHGNRVGGGELSSGITSFDWAEFELGRIATCSVDTTCTVWDVERAVVDAQLVAHDKEVYDISWGSPNIFGSVSGDGSVRVFDLRYKEQSTIIYENTNRGSEAAKPLLRLEWNKSDPRFVATVGLDSSKVVILDIRRPTNPIMELDRHQGSVNALSWAPHSGKHLCSVGDDSRALIWNTDRAAAGFHLESPTTCHVIEPERWYGSVAGINNVRWSSVESEWIGITFLNKLQVLRV